MSATVGRDLAALIKFNRGVHPGFEHEGKIEMIVEFESLYGGLAYGLVYEGEQNIFEKSEIVGNPRIYWESDKS